MVEVKPLTTLDVVVLKNIITNYVAYQRYTVNRHESDEKITIQLELISLETPFIKRYEALDQEQLKLYQNAIGHRLSFGAFEADEMVGVALAEPHAWNRSLWVWEFHVAENYRGQGIGRNLMDTLIEKGRAAGLRTIVCETQNVNVPAINFYRKMGFVLEGIDLSYYSNEDWPDGEVAVFMKRKLP